MFCALNTEAQVLQVCIAYTSSPPPPPPPLLSRPDSDYQYMRTTMPAVWVKMCSSWLGLAIYLWTLVAPVILTDRDFS